MKIVYNPNCTERFNCRTSHALTWAVKNIRKDSHLDIIETDNPFIASACRAVAGKRGIELEYEIEGNAVGQNDFFRIFSTQLREIDIWEADYDPNDDCDDDD